MKRGRGENRNLVCYGFGDGRSRRDNQARGENRPAPKRSERGSISEAKLTVTASAFVLAAAITLVRLGAAGRHRRRSFGAPHRSTRSCPPSPFPACRTSTVSFYPWLPPFAHDTLRGPKSAHKVNWSVYKPRSGVKDIMPGFIIIPFESKSRECDRSEEI